MKKIIIIVLITAAGSLHVSAQQFVHEFSVYGGGGLSSLLYQISAGDKNIGMGGNFGLGYTINRSVERVTSTETIFRGYWGIYTGIGLSIYNTKANLNTDKPFVTKGLTDSENERFEFHSSFSKYTELQSAMFVNIPVMAQYQSRLFYVMGGLKFAIPVTSKYSSKDVTLTNEAYYPLYKNWAKTQEFAGCGRFKKDFDGSLELGLSVLLSLEGGMKFRLADKLSLFTGVYFDYGLNNSFKGSPEGFIKYDPENPSKFSANSVLSLDAEKVRIMSVGLKLRLTLEK